MSRDRCSLFVKSSWRQIETSLSRDTERERTRPVSIDLGCRERDQRGSNEYGDGPHRDDLEERMRVSRRETNRQARDD